MMMKKKKNFKPRAPLLWVDTGDRPSNSAAELSRQEGFRRNRTSKFIREADTIINWGSTAEGDYKNAHRVLNKPAAVAVAVNKLSAFNVLKAEGLSIPAFTTSKAEAVAWNRTFLARTKLTGHSGEGIIVVDKGTPIADVPDAPLYTLYIYKVREFRNHVVKCQVVDYQQKIRDPNREPKTWKIRSHENGFIFVREGLDNDRARDRLCVEAVSALGLDFGAVDVIEDNEGHYYVLEINTAPGLEGRTVTSYAKAFHDY